MSEVKQYLTAKNFFLAILVVAVISAGFIIFRQHDTITLTKTQLESLTDTVRITRNKLGQEVATRRTIAGDLKTAQVELKIAKAAPELQALAKDKRVVTGIVSTTSTKEDTTVKITSADKDTIVSAPVSGIKSQTPGADTVIYENFVKTITDPWYSATITKKNDSVGLDLTVKNKYVSSITKKGNSYILTQTNLNPHTTTQDIQSYTITPPPAKNGKWFGYGSLLGFLIGVVVFIIK